VLKIQKQPNKQTLKDLKEGSDVMRQFVKILRFTSDLKGYYVVIGILSALLSASQLLQPVLTGRMIDVLRAGTSADVRSIVWLVLLLFAVDAGSGLFNNINGFLGDRMSAKLHKIMATRYYAHLLGLPQKYFDTELSGKIIGRLNRGTQQISQFINMFANNFLQFVVTTVMALLLAFRYSWLVAAELAVIYPIFIALTIRTSTKWQQWQADRNHQIDTAIGRFGEGIAGVKVVKSFVQESRELKFFTRHMTKFVSIGKPQSTYFHTQDVVRRIFLAVYMTIFVQAAKGMVTPGEAVTLMLLAYQVRMPIFSISFLVDNTQRAVADSKDYFAVMDEQPTIVDNPKAPKLVVKKGLIEFKDVSFGYDHEMVLKNLTFTIAPDTKIALVGESGEGKTTITNLLMRLYDVSKGTIEIDGQDIRGVTQESLRRSIGVVFQDPSLFSGTIRENISYANPDASDEQVVLAAKAANAHEFIEKFEKGYDSEIGERGLKLSGGQKQRIAIARAILKDAPILVLDEATSSLDNKSELLVQEALERLMKDRTTIIIAHRLSTIQNVDSIITLKGGKVDEIGSPRKLSHTDGIYARLLKLSRHKSAEEVKKALSEFEIKA
jgi:ATP-binding cassette subfamily B protein